MMVYKLYSKLKALVEEGKGELEVVMINSSSGASDKVDGSGVSDHFGDEGPFDLEGEEYFALFGG